MTPIVSKVLEVRALPPEQQETAARILLEYVAEHGSADDLEHCKRELAKVGLIVDPRIHVLGLTNVVTSFAIEALSPRNMVRHGAHPREPALQVDWLLDENEEHLKHRIYLSAEDTHACLSGAIVSHFVHATKHLSSLDSVALLQFYARRAYMHQHHKRAHFDDICSGDQFTDCFRGYEGLAAVLGLGTGGHARDRLEPVLTLHRALRGTFCGLSLDGLVSFNYGTRPGSNKPTLLITYLPPLRPSFFDSINARVSEASLRSQAMQIVPMVGLPPLFGRALDHGRQALAAIVACRYIRSRAAEFYERGGVELGRLELERIAAAAGYARRRIGDSADSLRDGWLRPSRNAPEMLAPVGPQGDHRYRLGSAHEAANESIHEAGKRMVRGKAWAQSRSHKKADMPQLPRRASRRAA